MDHGGRPGKADPADRADPADPADKAGWRGRVLAARRALTASERAAAAAAITAAVLEAGPVRALTSEAVVAAYLSMPTEPATGELLSALAAQGHTVLVPVLRPDRNLDWTRWTVGAATEPGEVAGPDAINAVALVLVPALACAADGTRLGRGGGSYDRALARVPPGVVSCALLYDGELVADLPRGPHDVPVTAACLPSSGWTDLGVC